MGRPTSLTGFTAIELLVTFSIVAILATIAVPSLRDFVLNNRSVTHMNEFVTAVNLARDEAVKRGAPVTLCSSQDPQANNPACDGGQQWERGWILFADYDRDATMDLGTGACLTEEDCLLRVWDGIEGMTLLTPARTRITFDGTGASRGFNATWTLCDERGAQDARAVALSNTGRIRQLEDTNGDHVPDNGNPDDLVNVSCP